MPTTTKKFHFTTTTEGWVSSTSSGNIRASWRKPKSPHHIENNPIGVAMGGCLRVSALGNDVGTGTWTLATTWEALGVPSGKVVTSVVAEYMYRWDFGKDFVSSPIAANSASSGPFVLLDNSDNQVGVLSQANYLPSGVYGGRRHYPTYPTWQTGLTTNDVPLGWATATGAAIAVPSNLQASNSTIKFKVNVGMPSIPLPTSGTKYGQLRCKQDRFVIEATYADPQPTTQRRFFII